MAGSKSSNQPKSSKLCSAKLSNAGQFLAVRTGRSVSEVTGQYIVSKPTTAAELLPLDRATRIEIVEAIAKPPAPSKRAIESARMYKERFGL